VSGGERGERAAAVAGSAVFLVVAPGFVAGLAPWWISGWRMQPPLLGLAAGRLVGGLLIGLGAIGLLDCFRRFAVEGLGTPAPIRPTRTLVVGGLYRLVRNPMYVAVVAAILGQALLLGDAAVLGYGVLIWLAFHVFVLAYEEPALRTRFGAAYAAYCAHVRRWIPRLRPWRGPPA
jgi:protein-S-isoprenylcysteine O-methyltransferase Ste14